MLTQPTREQVPAAAVAAASLTSNTYAPCTGTVSGVTALALTSASTVSSHATASTAMFLTAVLFARVYP